MLTIHFGREDVDKEAFMFSEIHKSLRALGKTPEQGGRILLVVPDQFTLQAERDAFFYLQREAFIDLEIIGLSGLRHRIIKETGSDVRIPIDKEGRQMLLTLILRRRSRDLKAISVNQNLREAATLINNIISEMKLYNITIEDIQRVIKSESQPILARKLTDLLNIYVDYEAAVAGKYLDSEDHIAIVTHRIPGSKWISDSEIWLYGFDYLSIRDLDVVQALFCQARAFNVMLTADSSGEERLRRSGSREQDSVRTPESDGLGGEPRHSGGDEGLFRLTRQMIADLHNRASVAGVAFKIVNLNKQNLPLIERPKSLKHIERELFSFPYKEYKDSVPEITLLSAANYYAEADSAAFEIYRLVREQGYRYRDILVICNDMDVRAAVIKRVFSQYNLPLFIDRKKSLHHNPVLEYISTLIDIATGNWKTEEIVNLIKTGFSPLSIEESEILDEYATEFQLKWKRDWQNPAVTGHTPPLADGSVQAAGYSSTVTNHTTPVIDRPPRTTNLEVAEQARLKIINHIDSFMAIFHESKDAAKKTEALYMFLHDEARLPERLSLYIQELRDKQKHLYADELSQLWDQLMEVFDQITAIAGEAEVSGDNYKTLLMSGLERIEIGLIPTTLDQILLGSMQRTRPGRVKALFILGANDGVLPAEGSSEGLFTKDERIKIFENHHFGKADKLKDAEEQLAIYRNLSRPLERLWVSYSASNPEGNELRPSLIFEKIRRIFPFVTLEKDIGSRNEPLKLIGTKDSTLNHMAAALRTYSENEEAASVWNPVYAWYREHAPEHLRAVVSGLLFTNRRESIRKDYVRRLFGGKKRPADTITEFDASQQPSISISPSSIEKYAHCPFSHFINYGLRPKERRLFQIGPRERGNLLHLILMEYSKELTETGVPISDNHSGWMRLTKTESDALVDRLFGAFADPINNTGRRSDSNSGNIENYRILRIKDATKISAWTLAEHVKAGRIDQMFFEERFGVGKRFPAIINNVDGLNIILEGQIDRVDVIGGRAKIIDYKSGNESFNIDDARSGWKLQLMLYLQTVTETAPTEADEMPETSSVGSGGMSGVTSMYTTAATYMPEKSDSDLTTTTLHSHSKWDNTGETTPLKPAGVFYFRIMEPRLDCGAWLDWSVEEDSDKLTKEIRKSFRMDGLVLDDQEVLRAIAGTEWGGKHFNKQGFSDIIPVKAKSESSEAIKLVKNHAGSVKVLDEAGLIKLQMDVRDKLGQLCTALANGEIDVAPGRSKTATACDYCGFKGICAYDPTFA